MIVTVEQVMATTTYADLDAYWRRDAELREKWLKTRDTPARWATLREVYAFHTPRIMQARSRWRDANSDPYLVSWDFTPIEDYLWTDIRIYGVPLFPQYPVGRYFIDFGDPWFKIGLEADGKDFHDTEKDRKRDEYLWSQGWRIFRIPGRDTLPAKNPFEERWENQYRENREEFEYAVQDWLDTTSEGVVWALDLIYYTDPERRDKSRFVDQAYRCLNKRRLIDFDLMLEGDE